MNIIAIVIFIVGIIFIIFATILEFPAARGGTTENVKSAQNAAIWAIILSILGLIALVAGFIFEAYSRTKPKAEPKKQTKKAE